MNHLSNLVIFVFVFSFITLCFSDQAGAEDAAESPEAVESPEAAESPAQGEPAAEEPTTEESPTEELPIEEPTTEEPTTEELPTEESSAEEPATDGSLPDAAARHWHLVEPLGLTPSPWAALAGVIEGGISVDGDTAWSAVAVHCPVAHHYGAVDARLVAKFDEDGFESLGPEIILRGIPLRVNDGRGVFGFSFAFLPEIRGQNPLMTLGGGLMGGFLGRRWFTWAHAGVSGEVLQQGNPIIWGTIAGGARLPYGIRPQVEIDISWEAPSGDPEMIVRPGLRYWPREFIGIGVSADIYVLGDEDISSSVIRLDVVGHALE